MSTVNDHELAERLADYFRRHIEKAAFSGVVSASMKGRIRFIHPFGTANIERGERVDVSTRFLIASITKPVTAAAILMLAERGRIRLSDSVRLYLPDIDVLDERITIHQLLTHTAGLPDFETQPGYFQGTGLTRLPAEAIFDFIGSTPSDFEPGTQWRYTSTGYNVLGLLIDRVSGVPYEKFVQQEIIGKLGLGDTGFADEELTVDAIATGYTRTEDGVTKAVSFAAGNFRASGNMFSTADNLLILDRALADGTLLQAESLKLLYGRHAWTGTRHYGYGFSVYDRSRGHGGSLPGFKCAYRHYPEREAAIVLLGNRDYADVSGLLEGAESIILIGG